MPPDGTGERDHTPPPSWFVLRFTVREFLGVVAGLSVGGWVLRAAAQAEGDAGRLDSDLNLGLPLFFLRRLRGLGPTYHRLEVLDIYDWHERWDHYVAACLLLGIAALLGVLVVRQVAKRGRGRPALAVMGLILILLAGSLAGWVVRRNRVAARDYHRWAAIMERRARDDIRRYSGPTGTDYLVRNATRAQANHRADRARYAALAERPWHRLLLPLSRPRLVPGQLQEVQPQPLPTPADPGAGPRIPAVEVVP